MKQCAQCHGKLGLGVRSQNLWNGRWWIYVRYCSIHCEELVMGWSDANTDYRWYTPSSLVAVRRVE